jgi:UDP-N-acetylmuramoylalanine--D-glutamate ligase
LIKNTSYNKVIILGAAESGVGAALLAKQRGYDVFVSEKGAIDLEYKSELVFNNISFEEGDHSDKIYDADVIIKSPGISDKVEVIKKLKEKNIPVISEIEFAAMHTDGKVIAITGTNGKSTTTSLIYHILYNAGVDVSIVGNIGKSFAKQVAERDTKYYVCEISSFQLDNCNQFKPYIAILTNITINHLDRYEYNMDLYAAAKMRLIQNQTEEDYFIYNIDDEGTLKYLPKEIKAQQRKISFHPHTDEGAYIDHETIFFNNKNTPFTMNLFDLALQGKHNAYNSMAAGVGAQVIEIRKESIRESLQDFQNLEHRLEFVADLNNIQYINDSKATNVNSVWYALESMNRPVIWIAGGVDKGNDYSQIQDIVKQKVKVIICLGKDNRKIHEAFNKKVDMIINTESMQDAVATSRHFASSGDVVLLSPGCASFDLFQDFEDRGRQFKENVKSL